MHTSGPSLNALCALAPHRHCTKSGQYYLPEWSMIDSLYYRYSAPSLLQLPFQQEILFFKGIAALYILLLSYPLGNLELAIEEVFLVMLDLLNGRVHGLGISVGLNFHFFYAKLLLNFFQIFLSSLMKHGGVF